MFTLEHHFDTAVGEVSSDHTEQLACHGAGAGHARDVQMDLAAPRRSGSEHQVDDRLGRDQVELAPPQHTAGDTGLVRMIEDVQIEVLRQASQHRCAAHAVAPAVAPAVVVIRTQNAPDFGALPTLARVEAGKVALAAMGFTEEEVVALAASGNDTSDSVLAGSAPDLESVASAPDAETKLAAAAEAFLTDVGTIDEYFQANADPAAEAAFNEALSAQCPILTASLASA